MAPAMRYCIYCGNKLSEMSIPVVNPPQQKPSTPSTLPPTVTPPMSTNTTSVSTSEGIDTGVSNLMTNITAIYERKVALVELLPTNQVSEKIFLKLYNEYNQKLFDLKKIRNQKVNELQERLIEGNKRFNEVNLILEELEVRNKIGEIDLNIFTQKAGKLKTEKQELMTSLKTLKTNFDYLEKNMTGKRPLEIRELENKMSDSYNTLQKLGEEKISKETLNAIKKDIEETLNFLNSQLTPLKKLEKELLEQLELLQTRHKVSEVSIEEYEKKKHDLQEELNKVWN
jgi:chromosome segregation ATPase